MRTKKELLSKLFELNVPYDDTYGIVDKKNDIHLEILIDIRDILNDISINIIRIPEGKDIFSQLLHK